MQKTKKWFFKNLAKVFIRFKLHRITFNPDKVFLSDTSRVFVGHEITSEGVRFSSNKLNGVEIISQPITKGNLKSFVGLANYFRAHVRNHSILTQSLNVLLPNYSRTQESQINVDGIFEISIFRTPWCCSKLSYVIFYKWRKGSGTRTYASDYGIGGFLCHIDLSDDVSRLC